MRGYDISGCWLGKLPAMPANIGGVDARLRSGKMRLGLHGSKVPTYGYGYVYTHIHMPYAYPMRTVALILPLLTKTRHDTPKLPPHHNCKPTLRRSTSALWEIIALKLYTACSECLDSVCAKCQLVHDSMQQWCNCPVAAYSLNSCDCAKWLVGRPR